MKRTIHHPLLPLVVFLSLMNFLSAQEAQLKQIHAPLRASITQSIGETELTISYHRLEAGGREVWGGVVPFNQVWLAEADNLTLFATSQNILVENQRLKAGTYRLFLIPTEGKWIMMFHSFDKKNLSRYNPGDNSVIISVQPKPVVHEEWLSYNFSDFTPSSAEITLSWGMLAFSFTVTTGDLLTLMVDGSVQAQFVKNQKELPSSAWDLEIDPEQTITVNQKEIVSLGDNSQSAANYEAALRVPQPVPYLFQPVEKNPIPVNTPSPIYPDVQRKFRMEGMVRVKMWVTKQGKVGKAEILESDCAAFDQPTLDAAMQWTFAPAITNNGPVAMWVVVPFYFKAGSN